MPKIALPRIPFPNFGPKRQLTLQDLKRGVMTGIITIVFVYFAISIYFVTLLFFEAQESSALSASLAGTHHMDICSKISSHPYPVFRCMNASVACTYAPSQEKFECVNFRK